MARPHAKLRGALMAADINQQYLKRIIGRGSSYISNRMSGNVPWSLDECYTILDLLHIPHNQLPEYFPYYPPKGA